MSVKIRLQRRGRKQRPFYHIVVADARAPRDGRFIEKIGTYNPMTKPATIELDRERAFDWMEKGAQPTDTARAILRFKGVMYMRHLQRGVKKGALTQEQADEMFTAWLTDKENKIRDRVNASLKEQEDWNKMLAGTAKPFTPKVEEVEEEAPSEEGAATEAEAPAEEAAAETAVEETAAEEPAAEATEAAAEEPAAEEPVAEAAEEAAAEEEAPAAEAAEESTEDTAEESEEAPAAEEEAPAQEETAEDTPAEEAAEEANTEESAEEDKE